MDEIYKSKPTQNYKRNFKEFFMNQRENATPYIANFGGGLLVTTSWYFVSIVPTPLTFITFGLACIR